jgi:hypothetical protein
MDEERRETIQERTGREGGGKSLFWCRRRGGAAY